MNERGEGSEVLDPEEWVRIGGSRREFPGLVPAAIPTLVSRLPGAFSPYALVAHELVGEGRSHVEALTPVPLEDLLDWVSRGVWQYFLVSRVLSAAVLDNLSRHSLRSMSVNGALNIQIGRRTRDGEEAPSIGLVRTVGNVSGQRRKHTEYEKVYAAATGAARRLITH